MISLLTEGNLLVLQGNLYELRWSNCENIKKSQSDAMHTRVNKKRFIIQKLCDTKEQESTRHTQLAFFYSFKKNFLLTPQSINLHWNVILFLHLHHHHPINE